MKLMREMPSRPQAFGPCAQCKEQIISAHVVAIVEARGEHFQFRLHQNCVRPYEQARHNVVEAWDRNA